MRRPSRSWFVSVLSAATVLALPMQATAVIPDEVPDRGPLLSEPVARGALVRAEAPPRTPTAKTVDGRPGDWVGAPSRIGGTTRLDAGELIHSDFLFDAFGADDGADAERMQVWGSLASTEDRTHRLAMLQQAAGDQFGAREPIGADDHYGDHNQRGVADLSELRLASTGDTVEVLARTTNLTDASTLGVILLSDTDGADGATRQVGSGTGLVTARFDVAVLLTADGATFRDLASGATSSTGSVAVDADGWTNALEARVPADVIAPNGSADIAVLTGTRTSGRLTPANVAFRDDEPVDIYNDRRQALALHDGNVDGFTVTLDIAELRSGASEDVRPGPGYHERVFTSSEEISRESGEHGILQRYGLYVPTAYDPGTPTPTTFWLHYRGGKAHSGAAWTPRIINQLGEEQGNLVVTPHARGTSEWYVAEAHQDVWEVFVDVHDTVTVDPQRRYLSGYSMGGYGTYLFGLLYPDLFAAGFPQSGAVTQGAWTGEGPGDCRLPCFVEANDGDADAQLTYRVLENARHFLVGIDHGSNDELVPITGVQRMALRLRELGYRYRMTMFDGYEHYSQAIVDEWADGAEYLNRFILPEDPRHVTYKVVPALTHALNTIDPPAGAEFDFDPDGAWWVDDVEARDVPTDDDGRPATDAFALVDAVAQSRPGTEPGLLLPEAGVASVPDHSTPFTRHGQHWALPENQPTSNGFEADLTNVATVTLDTPRMDLSYGEDIFGVVTTDGATELILANAEPVWVYLDGIEVKGAYEDGQVRLELDAADHLVQLVPRKHGGRGR